MMKIYLGLDVGSVSTNLALVDKDNRVLFSEYLRTRGQPIKVVQEGLGIMASKMPAGSVIAGVGGDGKCPQPGRGGRWSRCNQK